MVARHPAARSQHYAREGELVLRGPTFASQQPDAAHGGNLLFLVRSWTARPVWFLSGAAFVMTPREKAALQGFFASGRSSLSTRAGLSMHSCVEA